MEKIYTLEDIEKAWSAGCAAQAERNGQCLLVNAGIVDPQSAGYEPVNLVDEKKKYILSIQ